MDTLDLGHLLRFEGGLDATCAWADMLSGGEAQRLGFARLFAHGDAVSFCIMDEATSALDTALEERCMQLCADANVPG